MILRFFAFLVMIYALAFLAFAVSLPQPLGRLETDAVLVPTGGAGRIQRGLEVIERPLEEATLTRRITELTGGRVEARFARLFLKLAAEMADGTLVVGESLIPEAKGKIERLRCIPENPKTLPEVLEAVQRVLG